MDPAKARFNDAHCSTRNTVERTFGVVKRRFYSLSTGLRVKKLSDASKIVISCFILHNLCIQFGDNVEDLEDKKEKGSSETVEEQGGQHLDQQVGKRNQLLRFFQRNWDENWQSKCDLNYSTFVINGC